MGNKELNSLIEQYKKDIYEKAKRANEKSNGNPLSETSFFVSISNYLDKYRKIVFKGKNDNLEIIGLSCYLDCITKYIRSFFLRSRILDSNGLFVEEKVINSNKDLINSLVPTYYEANKVYNSIESAASNIEYSSIRNESKNNYKRIVQYMVFVLYELEDQRFEELAYEGVSLGLCNCASLLIRYYWLNNDLNKANEVFLRAETIVPENENSAINLSMIYSYMFHAYYNVGLYENAINIVDKAEEYASSNPFILNNISKQRDIRRACGEFRKKITDTIIKITSISVPAERLKQEFSDDVIALMSNNVKRFVSTAFFVYDYINNQHSDDMDYSACVMPLMKAVEEILFRIVGEEYLAYLKGRSPINIARVPDVFKQHDSYHFLDSLTQLEIGKAISCIKKKDGYDRVEYRPQEYFVAFCADNNANCTENELAEIIRLLCDVKDMRNHAAHISPVTQMDAEECWELIVKVRKLIATLLTTFRFCFTE